MASAEPTTRTKFTTGEFDPTPRHALNDAERNAMRAYLQRCEVRLSTLHRIATAFISGAGLLLLIPIFFKDAIDNLLAILLAQLNNQFETLAGTGITFTIALFAALLYPLFVSLSVPLYGVYLLLKDIIHFYFTIYAPGFAENLLNPSFALSGVMFSIDESPRGKEEVMRYQYKAAQMGFMIPFSREKNELYFDSIINSSQGAIIPESRNMERLIDLDVLPHDYEDQSIKRFNAALGMARSIDRTLVQEVAVTEMSLVRHVLYLRRLMMRYVKTLLMFIWTTVVSFLMLPLLKEPRFDPLLIMALGYLIWSLAVMRIMDWPLEWIYKHRRESIPLQQIDPQLRSMQQAIEGYARSAIYVSAVAVVLALAALIW